jgi:formamidopyrimidine-DNA glycosylase
MPELPEVESYARYFARHALRKPVRAVEVRDARVLEVRPAVLERALAGRSFRSVRRHGKHLFAAAGQAWLRLHFGMSGDLEFWRANEAEPRFARVVFHFRGGGTLGFLDMRLFGRVGLVSSPDDFIRERRLGPDPLDRTFGLPRFRDLVAQRRGAIKAVLMTQEILAGVGNLYADETLFQAGVDPRRPASSLAAAEIAAVYSRLRQILREAISRTAAGREYPRRWLFEHREADAECPLCGGEIMRTVVFGRTTYFCRRHQR